MILTVYDLNDKALYSGTKGECRAFVKRKKLARFTYTIKRPYPNPGPFPPERKEEPPPFDPKDPVPDKTSIFNRIFKK